jgi:hypothetical protein
MHGFWLKQDALLSLFRVSLFSYRLLVMSLRRLAPKIRIAVLWHGTFLQHHYDFDWQSFRSIDRLYSEGIIWKVGFVKQRMAEVMANRGIRTGFVRNFVRDIPERPSDPLPGGLHFGMWFLYQVRSRIS